MVSTRDLDAHIFALRKQCEFFAQEVDATDEDTPSWIAKDCLVLRKQTVALMANMQKFRQALAENFGEPQEPSSKPPPRPGLQRPKSPKRISLSNGEDLEAEVSPGRRKRQKRISDVAANPEPESDPRPETSDVPPQPQAQGSAEPTATTESSNTDNKNDEEEKHSPIRYENIGAEVDRRLREKRIQELMSSPLSAQKRKNRDWDSEDGEFGSATGINGNGNENGAADEREREGGSPQKRFKLDIRTNKRGSEKKGSGRREKRRKLKR